MADLSTHYMGINLRNPLIVGSCGLTSTVAQVVELEKNGAGAVVLKSLFEEQIRAGAEQYIKSDHEKAIMYQSSFNELVTSRHYDYDLALDYIQDHAKQQTLNTYLDFVTEAKKSVDIPVIASINCVTAYDWQFFARSIQDCGVDAIELNVFLLPSDFNQTADQIGQTYNSLIEEIRNYVTIPLSLKIGYYASNLAQLAVQLSETGINALVLFNRPYNPDIDINTLRFITKNVYSSGEEYVHTLRWIGILSGRVKCDLAASSGIHDADSVIKQILAGADAVQMVSAIYKNGAEHIGEVLKGINQWMDSKKHSSVQDFRGLMSQKNIENPAAYERVQFMKHYSGIE
jgi:dihydroorotate dehydrogenase (fumarate)